MRKFVMVTPPGSIQGKRLTYSLHILDRHVRADGPARCRTEERAFQRNRMARPMRGSVMVARRIR